MALRDAPQAPVLGRRAELERVTAAIDGVAAGGLRVVFVEGEAGIGKTRLVTEALRLAAQRGFQVRRGAAYELERERPFRGLAEALAADGFPTGGEGRHTATTDDPAKAGAAVPAGDAGFAVVEATVDLLGQVAFRAPVALALEDLHWRICTGPTPPHCRHWAP